MTFSNAKHLNLAPELKGRRSIGLAAIFTATIFLSATLLFSVQPMFTKLILPLLGGASNVWNTAMVFFEAMLLGGYILWGAGDRDIDGAGPNHAKRYSGG